jgi:glycosyltransferase involved in cell wall biosynthesis
MKDTLASTRQPIRACHVAYTFYELDNRVLRYVQALAARGDRVDVIALRQPGCEWREIDGQVSLYRIQRRSTTERGALTYLLKILWFFLKSSVLVTALQLRHRYDLVHVHNVPDFLVFVAWLPKIMGARVILDIHDILPELYAGKFGVGPSSMTFRSLLAVERVSCRFADQVIVANHLWQERLTARNVSASRCTTILNYPDLSVFGNQTSRERPASPFLVLYPGTLNHHQGVDIAVRAFAIAAPEMPGAEFHVYGRGPDLPMLVRLARELRLEDRIQFKESVGLTKIGAIMASASVGVVPKRADGFGNEAFSTKILEFMASGVPVIVNRTRIDEHYFDETLVNFFDGTAEDLARLLLQVYRHPEAERERTRTALEFAVRHGWQARSGEYESLVDGLLEAPGRVQPVNATGTR